MSHVQTPVTASWVDTVEQSGSGDEVQVCPAIDGSGATVAYEQRPGESASQDAERVPVAEREIA
jgi:hypothetical protein